MAWQGIVLVREQSPNVHIAALRQRGPDDLIAQAGNPHGIGAGEGQHGLQSSGLRQSRLKQQCFLVQCLRGGDPSGAPSSCCLEVWLDAPSNPIHDITAGCKELFVRCCGRKAIGASTAVVVAHEVSGTLARSQCFECHLTVGVVVGFHQ